MRMQTIYEKMGGTYRQVGDYLLPDIEAPESPQIGIWGQRRLQYLRTHKRVLYTTMLMSDAYSIQCYTTRDACCYSVYTVR